MESIDQAADDSAMSQDDAEATDLNAHRGSEVMHIDGEPDGESLLSRCCDALSDVC